MERDDTMRARGLTCKDPRSGLGGVLPTVLTEQLLAVSQVAVGCRSSRLVDEAGRAGRGLGSGHARCGKRSLSSSTSAVRATHRGYAGLMFACRGALWRLAATVD